MCTSYEPFFKLNLIATGSTEQLVLVQLLTHNGNEWHEIILSQVINMTAGLCSSTDSRPTIHMHVFSYTGVWNALKTEHRPETNKFKISVKCMANALFSSSFWWHILRWCLITNVNSPNITSLWRHGSINIFLSFECDFQAWYSKLMEKSLIQNTIHPRSHHSRCKTPYISYYFIHERCMNAFRHLPAMVKKYHICT